MAEHAAREHDWTSKPDSPALPPVERADGPATETRLSQPFLVYFPTRCCGVA